MLPRASTLLIDSAELTEIFRQDPAQLSLPKQAFAEKNAEAMTRIGHELNEEFANLAANGPSATAGAIEEIAGSHDLSRGALPLDRVEQELGHMLISVEAIANPSFLAQIS